MSNNGVSIDDPGMPIPWAIAVAPWVCKKCGKRMDAAHAMAHRHSSIGKENFDVEIRP